MNQDTDFTKYQVSLNDSLVPDAVVTVQDDTTYTLTGLNAGTRYYVKIVVFDGGSSTPGNEADTVNEVVTHLVPDDDFDPRIMDGVATDGAANFHPSSPFAGSR